MPEKSGLPAGVRGSAAPWPVTRLVPGSIALITKKPRKAVTRVPTLVPPEVGRTLVRAQTGVNDFAVSIARESKADLKVRLYDLGVGSFYRRTPGTSLSSARSPETHAVS